jgi:4-amino-4-deoxy-L-arabinose transferase-like glycosyltransferase
VTEEQGSGAGRQPSKFALYCLAMVGGLGMTLMMTAAMLGVIYGSGLGADSTHSLGLMLVSGLLLLVVAIGFWLGWVRPFERFDDINVPAEPEHH